MSEITIDDIKSRLRLEDVVERYGYALKRDGSEYKGAISATSKSGKSLNVNPDKQVYNDFAGHAGSGDVLDFIAFAEGLDIHSDFRQVLRIAAEMAGITLDDKTDYSLAAERRELHRLFRLVCGYYHSCLTDADREYIRSKWGITDQIIDDLLIGIAPINCHLLQVTEIQDHFSTEVLKKSGLFYCNNNDRLVDIYRGRIIFPYWLHGEIVYTIGRDPTWDKDKNQRKFIKQLVNSDKFPYVSSAVENVLFGLDSIRGHDTIYITEGIADAIVLLQNGLPVISPVTTRIKAADIEKVVAACKGKKLVKIVNDNETNNSGLNGAIDTAKALEANGIKAEIIQLPKGDNVDKIDVAEFMLHHSKEDIEHLPGRRVYDIILDQIAPADNIPTDVLDKLEVARKIAAELSFLPEPARKAYVFETVKDRLKIKRISDLKAIYSEVVESQPVECPSVEDTFLRGNGQVRTKKLGSYVMGLNHYITMKDTKEVYIYRDGVYVSGGEDVIKKDVQDILGDYSTEQRQNEIVNYIRNCTLVQRNDIGYDCTKINLLNGIYNLETGELEPHTPDYISIRQLPIVYDPDATCPKIDKFLSEVMDDRYIQTILEFIGYCMIPDTRIQQSMMVYGPGRGGKTVLLSLLESFVGGCNCSRQSLHRLENDKYSVAELYGKLVNIFPDLASTALYDSNVFKQLTGNEKSITGERKYIPQFKFINTARLIFSANDLPPAPNGNYAFWRRWILIKMDRVFEGKNEDKNLIYKLTTPEELSGLFNRAIAALNTLLQNDAFTYGHSVSEVAEMYKLASDPIAAFAADCVKESVDDCLKAAVYSVYCKWCENHGLQAKAPNIFAKAFKRLGFEGSKYSRLYGYSPVWIGCSCVLAGSAEQPANKKPAPEEQVCPVGGLETPIVTNENKKNKMGDIDAAEKKENKIKRIEGSNPPTGQSEATDSEKTLAGCSCEPDKMCDDAVRAKGRCVDCGDPKIYGTSEDGTQRCKACYNRYFMQPPVVIPEEISLEG